MTPQQLEEKIKSLSNETMVFVTDLTGTQDHYQVKVVSPVFKGLSMIKSHRLVFDCVRAEIDSGELHALTLSTKAP